MLSVPFVQFNVYLLSNFEDISNAEMVMFSPNKGHKAKIVFALYVCIRSSKISKFKMEAYIKKKHRKFSLYILRNILIGIGG